jgi:hypothetical protein
MNRAKSFLKKTLKDIEPQVLTELQIVQGKVDKIQQSVKNVETTAIIMAVILCLVAIIALILYIIRGRKMLNS